MSRAPFAPLTATRAVATLTVLVIAVFGVRAGSGDALPALQKPAAAGAETPAQTFSKEWKMDDLLPVLADLGTGRDWAQGRELFKKGACGGCHALGREWEGAGFAPDLTAVASQFSREFILQSILEPSATINGRFFQTTFTLKDGKTVTGSVIEVADKKIIVAPIMLAPQLTVEIAQADVKSEAPSPISAMPPGLLNQFTKEQIVELFAFLDAGGDRDAPIYRKK